MIKIGLLGFDFKAPNKGCEALSYAFIEMLSDISNESMEIHVFSYGELGDIPRQYPKFSFVWHRLNMKNPIFLIKMKQVFDDCKCVFDITYGDGFSDIYGKVWNANTDLAKQIAIMSKAPLVLMPQTYGPFYTSVLKKWAIHLVKKADLAFSRDTQSAQEMHELGVGNLVVATDLAFALPYYKEKYDLNSSKRKVGINVSSLLWDGGHKAYGKETTYTIAPVILWDSSRVWKILTAYVYTGAMVLGKSQRLISGKKIIRIVPKGQQYITEGTHEAIVSREEFEKAQLVIRNNGHRVVMGSVNFPLKGKIRCGNCRRVLGYDYKQASPIFWCREGMELIGQTQCSSEIYQASDIENAVFQALKKELSLLDSLYSDIKKEEQSLKEASRKASRRKTLMEQELKNLKGEKMRMYEEYAAGTLSLDNYKSKKLECDRKIAEVQDKIEQFKAEESVKSVVPGTVRAAAEQAENFLHGTRLTASMVSAFIENVYVHEGGRIVVRFKYEQSIQDAVRALHTE